MNPPTVLTAGGASSSSFQQKKKQEQTQTQSASDGIASASVASEIAASFSGDRAAGSDIEMKVNSTDSNDGSLSNGISNNRSSSSSSEIMNDPSVTYDEEDISEMNSLLKDQSIDDLYKSDDTDANQNPTELIDPNQSYDDEQDALNSKSKLLWLLICFFGIMMSFVGYGLLLEYATSGGRKLHELSFLFVTSLLYTVTAAAGRHVRDETPTTIPPARFAVLGITSMGSTFCSVRSLRYVIFPIQVLAKSCKPVPVMIMGALMGKKYPLRKYLNVCLIVAGVGLFMGGGDASSKKMDSGSELSSSSQIIGIVLLFISLCFDGGTGAYEDKLMAVHSVGPFDLMYNIQLGKTIIAGVSLLVLNQVHVFVQMCQDMGLVLVALGLTGAMGQVFIFVTISKFGALTCSIIGLARKVTTLVASIYFYGHHLNGVQVTGLVVSVAAMVMNFMGKKGKGGGGHGHGGHGHSAPVQSKGEVNNDVRYRDHVPSKMADVEMPSIAKVKPITAGGR